MVRSCSDLYRYTGWWDDSSRFPESFLSRPTGSGYGCRVGLRGLSDVFRYAGQGRRRRSRNADCSRLLNAFFAQAVVGVVVVVLGCADGLFAGSSAVLVVAVVVSSEMQELVTANQVLAAFDSAGDIVFLNYISTINFFSLLISLINRGISCRACAINS